VSQPFKPKTVLSKQNVEVRRRADWCKQLNLIKRLSLHYLSPHSRITFRGTLNDFGKSSLPNPKKLLVGLKVETLDTDSTATIEEIVGTVTNINPLLAKASGISPQKL